MKIFTPSTTIEYADRNNLLQKSLRDSTLNFSIESEYPIVLNKEGGHFSYCFQQDSVLVAHANLWPRIATNKTTKQRWNIGLIGNVATDEQFRGLGIMSKVLAHLKSIAIDTNLSILILWSDLLEFYQKQGFWSFSEERRYIFTRNKLSTALSHLPIHDVFYTNHEIKRFNEAIFETFTHLRPKTFMTVERHPNEYMELLTIPNLNVFTSSNSVGKISAFAILGKGADMESVVHEWGGKTALDILKLLEFILTQTDRDALMLLAPTDLHEGLHIELNRFAEAKEEHPMALVWQNPSLPIEELEQLQKLFIWGLDSI